MDRKDSYSIEGEEGESLKGDAKTKIQVSLGEDFWKFVKGFKNGEGDRVYELRLNQIGYSSPEPLVIDFYDLYDYDEELARHLLVHPVKSIEQFESVAHKNKVRIRHLAETTPIREIDTAKIARLIMVQGIVVKAGQETSKIHKAVYECSLCGESYEMDQKYQYLARPEDRCGCKGTAKKWVFALDQSSFIDNQRVWIQESPEQLPPGQIPERLEVDLNSELVGTVKPGDRVHITGYAHLKMKNPISTKLELSRFMIANYVETTNKYMDLVELTEGEIKQIKELAKDPYIMRRIVRSIAPSIYGHVTIKKAIALQQFGSDAVIKPDIRKRGDIHILLIGDPGGGKSQLLLYATILSNRGIYSTGRGSTAAGLTATVLKEKGGEGYTLEVGTLIIADTGHASLDELEKMRDEDREAIHPAMEQQCYDESTEVLTLNGWKPIKQIEKDDLIATLNDGIELLYEKPTAFQSYWYKGKMLHVSDSKRVDLLVTPDHNLYVNLYKRANEWLGYDLTLAKEVHGKRMKFRRNAQWKGTDSDVFVLPSINKKINQFKTVATKPVEIDMNDWLSFLGYYIAEGSSTYHTVTITQRDIKKSSVIAETLKRLPFNFRKYGDHFKVSDVRLSSYLKPLGKAHEKSIPPEFKQLPSEKLQILIDAMMLGDGHYTPTSAGYTTVSRKLADDFQEILLKTGVSGTITEHETVGTRGAYGIRRHNRLVVSIINKNQPQVNYPPSRGKGAAHTKWVEHEGYVYCLTVPNHIIYVRRNGKPVWCGNCIPINKGGINLILNARCSILAAANPKLGRYNPHVTVAENINNLPITILNRFDLIFIMRDTPDEEKDAATSEIILDLMVDEPNLLTLKQLKQYIAYSKQIKPKLTEKVARHISDFYVKLRQQSKGDIEAAIMITPRQLESIIRLTKAHARAHLREEVTLEDANAAIDLFRESMKQVGIDPETGKYDIDLLESGIPRSLQKKLWTLIDIVGKFQKSSTDNTVSEEVLFEYLRDNWKMTDLKIKELVRTAERDGVIFSPLPGFYKKV